MQKCVHFGIFGSFGLSTKEPYTIMLCRWCHWHASSVHTSPSHKVRHRNFIFGTHIHICPPYMHIKYLVILACIFNWQPFWYFSLICCPVHTDSHRDFILHILMYLFFSFIHKRNYGTVNFFSGIYEHFLKIHLLFTSLSHLNSMCFDIWATKLCVLS